MTPYLSRIWSGPLSTRWIPCFAGAKMAMQIRALPGTLAVSYFLSELAGFSLQKHGICHVESEPAVIAWLASKGLF